jgi:putative membrane protein
MVTMKAETFFSANEKKQIEATIAGIEQKTSGEIAVMVVDQSDTYPEGRILAGILSGSLTALLITHRFFDESLWYFIPLAVIFAFLFGWAVRYAPPLFRYFIRAGRLESEVQERALRGFYEKQLYRTRDQTGVLFFLSLLEHRVWVLADRGIYARITPEELKKYAHLIAYGIKSGNACQVLCHEMEQVGEVLAAHFPIRDDDENELDNEIIIGK